MQALEHFEELKRANAFNISFITFITPQFRYLKQVLQ